MAIEQEVSRRQPYRLAGSLWTGLKRGMGLVTLAIILWSGYIWLGRPVTLVIDGQAYPLRLHRLTVEAVLAQQGLTLTPADSLTPPLGSELAPGDRVEIGLAQPVLIEVDGQTVRWLTRQSTVGALLAEARLELGPADQLMLEAERVAPDQPLPRRRSRSLAEQNVTDLLPAARLPRSMVRPAPLRLIIRRAIPVRLIIGRISNTFYTSQTTVEAALAEQNLTIFPQDGVTPGLDTRLTPHMRIEIQRAVPVTIVVDGRTLQRRSRQETVGAVLAQERIALMGQDYSRPAPDSPIGAGTVIEVVRVQEAQEIEQDLIAFETIWEADETMEIDRQEIRQPGTTGVVKTRSRVRYENGQEVARQVEDEWLAQVPSDRVIAYGTKIVVRTAQTAHGPIEYWRKISMLVTAYNAATSGKDDDHPRYGITRSGLAAGFGRVAVDAKVIPLLTNLYVPGYGPAVAADTGGRILGKHVDLGYNEDQLLPVIYEWREVYLLTPVPPAGQIRYVLPQWPQR